MKTAVFAASALALTLATVCHAGPAEDVRATEARWNADAGARDAAKFASYYAADGVDIAPGAEPARGPAAIQANMAEAFKDPNFSLTFAADRVEIGAGGDMAYTQGRFTETETGPGAQGRLVQSGAYVTVYRKQADGSWKAVADIASNGPPSAAPKAAD